MKENQSSNVLQVDKTYFMNILNTLDKDLRPFVDKDIVADRYYLLFDGSPIGGFAFKKNELKGVFSKTRGMGTSLITEALKVNKGTITCFCLGDTLKNFYKNNRFKVLYRVPWDDRLAPQDWNSVMFGTPALYKMQYDSDL